MRTREGQCALELVSQAVERTYNDRHNRQARSPLSPCPWRCARLNRVLLSNLIVEERSYVGGRVQRARENAALYQKRPLVKNLLFPQLRYLEGETIVSEGTFVSVGRVADGHTWHPQIMSEGLLRLRFRLLLSGSLIAPIA